MKFTIPQSSLIPALQSVSRSSGIRSTLPVLANVLISARDNQVSLSATNLELGVVKSVKAEVLEDGELTIPCRTFVELVSSLSDETLELESVNEQLKITTSKFKGLLNGIAASEFPAIPLSMDKSVSIDGKVLAKVLPEISFAAASEDGRPILTGILTQIKKGTLELVATDGFRLAHKKSALAVDSETSFRALIPRKTFEEVVRLMSEEDDLEQVEISTSESQNQIIFKINQTFLSSRLIEGQFPTWEKIIPTHIASHNLVDRVEILKAVKLASVFAKNSANIIKIQSGPKEMVLSSEAKELGSQSMSVPVEFEGESLTVAFNSRFLLDALNAAATPKVSLEFSGNLSAALVRPVDQEDLEYVIMPVRLN